MGTSKSFSDLTKRMPNWPSFSGTVTRNCDGSVLAGEKLTDILKGYVTAIGGASSAGRGGSKVAGRAGIRTAKKIGGFFAAFTNSGGSFIKALESTGLDNIRAKSVSDVVNHLIEYCSGPASTLDDKAAKEASRLLFEEILVSANSLEDAEELMQQVFTSTTHEELIIKYFGYYVLEHLSIWFYEKLVKEKGKTVCTELFRQLKNFIFESLKKMQKKNPLQKIDWGGDEADRLIKNIQQDVLTIFN